MRILSPLLQLDGRDPLLVDERAVGRLQVGRRTSARHVQCAVMVQ